MISLLWVAFEREMLRLWFQYLVSVVTPPSSFIRWENRFHGNKNGSDLMLKVRGPGFEYPSIILLVQRRIYTFI